MTTEERVVRDKYNAETVLMDTYEDVRELYLLNPKHIEKIGFN